DRQTDRHKKLLTRLEKFPVGFFICIVLLNAPYLVYLGTIDSNKAHIFSAWERNVFVVSIICLLLTFIRYKYLLRCLQMFILIVVMGTFVLDFYALYQYGHPFNAGMLDVVLSTNSHEAREYLEQFITKQFLMVLAAVFLVVGIIAHQGEQVSKKYITGKHIAWVMTLLLIFNLADMGKMGYDKWRERVDNVVAVMRLSKTAHITFANVREYEAYEKEATHNEVDITRDDSEIPYVIFVLGESTSRNHMSLYGYGLDTNPLLKKRQAEGGMYVFTDVVSHHSHTLPVMRELFTFYRREMEDEWFRHVNLFDILRQTDYHTAWLSNQEFVGIWSLDKFYSRRCKEKFFTDVRESRDDSTQPDGVLLPILKEVNYGEKNFLVIHLMGTHGDYKKRYPKEFEKFKAIDETKGTDQHQKEERAAYDNAVLYNDYIVDAIIDMYKEKDAVVIYVSDHADEVYEDRDFEGHMESMGTKHMIEVPMLIWTSPIFREKRPELTKRMAGAVDRPFMTDDMIHVLMDLMGVETVDYDPTKSVINSAWQETERIFSDMVYEKNGKESFLQHK
ncbi:MAG: lipid A phosphoethanolamine transferase, partial [Selenomonas sp.]|nr:lipid A phosphoethanolamine transferase [Selenomonas sp.]